SPGTPRGPGDPAFATSVRIRRPHRSADHLQALGSEHSIEPGWEVSVAIMDQETGFNLGLLELPGGLYRYRSPSTRTAAPPPGPGRARARRAGPAMPPRHVVRPALRCCPLPLGRSAHPPPVGVQAAGRGTRPPSPAPRPPASGPSPALAAG